METVKVHIDGDVTKGLEFQAPVLAALAKRKTLNYLGVKEKHDLCTREAIVSDNTVLTTGVFTLRAA